MACLGSQKKRPPCLPITPCRTSCASHDVGERIVRRQGIGAARLARERVSVRLAITCTICDQRGLTRIVQPICEASAILICRCNERARMGMVRHLSHTQSRFPDSAGNTRSCPPQTAPATGLSRPHDVRQRVVWRQTVGLARCPVQRVRVGLGAAGIWCRPFTAIFQHKITPGMRSRPLSV